MTHIKISSDNRLICLVRAQVDLEVVGENEVFRYVGGHEAQNLSAFKYSHRESKFDAKPYYKMLYQGMWLTDYIF